MNITVDTSGSSPPSVQIVEAILDRVASGELTPGTQLPSVRGLASAVLVNPNTVGRAYRDLAQMGVVRGRSGSGVFVTEEGPGIARDLRSAATLEAVSQAVTEALRAGHSPEHILQVVEGIVAVTTKDAR
ncbi:MAG: GntR family transcriptional regulator [Planctomycetota bacterium]